jgi:predicted SnoaL-like aldol condensation-catalyzing enzyme
MFRVAGGRLVEHWDAAALGEGPNASGHTALDGESVVADVELTGANEGLVLRFVEDVLVGQAYDAIEDYMSPLLVEHNPQGRDGSAAYVEYLQGNAITYRQLRHEIADGNFVFVLSEGAVGGTDVAHYDLFRVEDSLIVEHWDGRRTVPATTPSGLGIF